MKYNILGNTGLKVSELCLGTMTFGGRDNYAAMGGLEQQAVDGLMKQALDAGINFIDTANIYSAGLSEELTGQSIRNLGINRDELVLATKVRGTIGGGVNNGGLSRKHVMQQAEESLKRLQVDYIDLYQIHGYDPITPIEETLRTLDDLVRSGKVRYIGASNLAAWQLMKALDFSHYNNLSKFVSLQAYYTVAGRDLEREVIPVLEDQKVGLMVWSPLAGGLLSGKFSRDDQKVASGRRATQDFPPVNKQRAFDVIDILKELAALKGATVPQLALAWLLHQKAVTSIIIGANKKEQLSDNLKSVDIGFNAEELERLDLATALTLEYPGWMLDFMDSSFPR